MPETMAEPDLIKGGRDGAQNVKRSLKAEAAWIVDM